MMLNDRDILAAIADLDPSPRRRSLVPTAEDAEMLDIQAESYRACAVQLREENLRLKRQLDLYELVLFFALPITILVENSRTDLPAALDALDDADTRIAELEADNGTLRELLWMRHGCNSAALYGDDGRMDCNACVIDFKSQPAREIQHTWMVRGWLDDAAMKPEGR